MASDESLGRMARSFSGSGIELVIVRGREEARREVLARLPAGTEVFTAASATLGALGLLAEVDDSGRYASLRRRLAALPPAAHRERARLRSAPQCILGSVHAVTEDGRVLVASYGGSQLAAYAYGAERVIWVVGAQKVVPDLATGLRRLHEYSFPLEDSRMRETSGGRLRSGVGKVLVVNEEPVPGRISMIVVKESLGF